MPLCSRVLPWLALTAIVCIPLGCSRDANRPDPVPRYRNLGPKQNFPAYLDFTVLEGVDVLGIQPVVIAGYGLVVNLENTGRDDGIPAPVRESVMRNATVFGVGSALTEGQMGDLSAAQLLNDPRNAVVRVDAYVPPGARRGSQEPHCERRRQRSS